MVKPVLRIKPYFSLTRMLDALALAAAVSISIGAALSMGQDTSWDQKNYHYYSGYALLHKPLLYDFAPAQVQTFFNPLFHVPSYLMLQHLSTRTTAAILAALQGLNIWLIYRISKKLLGGLGSLGCELLAVACAATAFYGAVNLSELGATFGDNVVSILPLAAVLLLIDPLRSGKAAAGRWLWKAAAAGFLAGLACGLKLTVAIYAIPLAAVLTVLVLWSRIALRDLAYFLAAAALGFALTYGYWGLALYREYGNPVFPYLNSIFRSELYDLANTMDPRFLPRDWSERLFYPFYLARPNTLVSEPPFRDWRFAVCYVLVVALAISFAVRTWRRRAAPARDDAAAGNQNCLILLTGFVAIGYVLWQQLFSIYRYAAAIEFIAPVFIVVTLLHLFGRRMVAFPMSLAVLATICWQLVPMDFGRQAFGDAMLAVSPPASDDLAHSVVIMGSDEATAYIIPSFPAATRFVRIQGNWLYPGRNSNLDRKVAELLDRYPLDRKLVYLSNMAELQTVAPALSYFGLGIEADSCAPLEAAWGDAGYLCRGSSQPVPEAPPPIVVASEENPAFVDLPEVRLRVTPVVARVNRDTLRLQVINLKARAIDVLYTLDGTRMPAVRNWSLDANRSARVFVSAATRKGLYRYIGIRDSGSTGPHEWIRVDVEVRVH